MPQNWTRLDKDSAHTVIDRLAGQRDAVLFSPDTTEVVERDLPFYTTFRLVRLTNYATLPVFSLQYLCSDTDMILLDGTANPIYTVNEKDPVRLWETNVIPYLDFFFAQVQGSDGDVFLIRDPRKMPFMSSLSEKQQQSVVDTFRPLKVEAGPPLTVRGTLWYGGALIAATVTCDDTGKLAFAEQKMLLTGVYFPPGPMEQNWLEGTYDDTAASA